MKEEVEKVKKSEWERRRNRNGTNQRKRRIGRKIERVPFSRNRKKGKRKTGRKGKIDKIKRKSEKGSVLKRTKKEKVKEERE